MNGVSINRVFLHDSRYTIWTDIKELVEYDTRIKVNENVTTTLFMFIRILIINQLEEDAENEHGATKN